MKILKKVEAHSETFSRFQRQTGEEDLVQMNDDIIHKIRIVIILKHEPSKMLEILAFLTLC